MGRGNRSAGSLVVSAISCWLGEWPEGLKRRSGEGDDHEDQKQNTEGVISAHGARGAFDDAPGGAWFHSGDQRKFKTQKGNCLGGERRANERRRFALAY